MAVIKLKESHKAWLDSGTSEVADSDTAIGQDVQLGGDAGKDLEHIGKITLLVWLGNILASSQRS